jgi:hypothetical protein
MSNRNLRRLAGKKNAVDLAHMIHGLKEVAGGLKAAVPEATRELGALQEMLNDHRTTVGDLRYQLERQRTVFLRMFFERDRTPTDIQSILELESQYGAEYDALQFLCWIATLEDT